jgi:hypothetical protein
MLAVINQQKSAEAIKSNQNTGLFKWLIAKKQTVKHFFVRKHIVFTRKIAIDFASLNRDNALNSDCVILFCNFIT